MIAKDKISIPFEDGNHASIAKQHFCPVDEDAWFAPIGAVQRIIDQMVSTRRKFRSLL